MGNGNGDRVTVNTPPVVSFKTVKNALTDFKSKGVLPPRIDKRLWPTFSNTVATQLVAALKFLGLIDEAGVPTILLETMVDPGVDDKGWRDALSMVISSAYAPIMDMELDKIHGSHLRDKFKDSFGLESDAQRKAIAFFLFAARDAGMKLSPYLKLRERSASKGPRKKRAAPVEDVNHGIGAGSAGIGAPPPDHKPIDYADVTAEAMTRILKMKPPKKVQDAVMTVILYLSMGDDAFKGGDPP
jgi:hypothetical protein